MELYVQHTVEILREIRRVLRPDGVCFWNIGDSYSRDAAKGRHKPGDSGKQNYIIEKGGGRAANQTRVQRRQIPHGDGRAKDSYSDERHPYPAHSPFMPGDSTLKPKDLCLIPARVALAAQADGWWVRSDIIWVKPNPMPESCRDRPTDAYEHILMLTKSVRYFWDAEPVREPHARLWDESNGGSWAHASRTDENSLIVGKAGVHRGKGYPLPNPGGRNLRNVWTFPTQPMGDYACACGTVFSSRRSLDCRTIQDDEGNERTEYECSHCRLWDNWISHFATFPEELPRRCILAATSAKGACRFCGAPWERVVRKPHAPAEVFTNRNAPIDGMVYSGSVHEGEWKGHGQKLQNWLDEHPAQTTGWRPTCLCPGQYGRTAPCVVLDPFAGSGTTGRVAIELNRTPILIDLAYGRASSEEIAKGASYDRLADRRTRNVQRNLL